MRLFDVTEQSKFAATPQQEAIQNVNAASIFNVTPEIFKENKEEWMPELQEFERGPAQASPVVAENIQKDPETAAAVLPDHKELSTVEKIYNDGLQKIKGVTGRRRKRDDLNFDKMLFGLNEDEEFELEGLNEEAKNNFGDTDYKLSWLEELPGSVAAGLVDFGAVVARNKELVAGMTGGGALLGGTTGLVGGPVTGTAGAVAGGIAGFASGFAVAGFWDSFKQMAGSSYGEFSDITDATTGQPMDETTKKTLALGVGVIGGAVEFVSTKLLLKGLPGLKKFLTPKNIKIELAKNPALRESILKIARPMETKIAAALKAGATKESFLKELFKSGAIEGTEETVQDYMQMVGQGIAESLRDDKISFIEGIRTVSDNIAFDPKTQKNLATSFVVGGVVGSAVHTGAAIVDKGIPVAKELKNDFVKGWRDIEGKKPPPAAPTETKVDVNVEGQQKVELKPTVTDPVQAATQILELQNVVSEAGDRLKGTGVFKQSPALANQLRKQMLPNAPDVYFDVDELQEKFGGDEEKMNKINEAFNIAPETPNAQRSMPLHRMMELVDSGIDLDVFMRLHPEGPNPKSAEAFAKKKAEDNKRREDMLGKLGAAGEKTPEQRASEIPMKEMSTEELTLALGSKEVADQYMLNLDANAEEVKKQPASPEQIQTLAAIEHQRRKTELIKETLPDDDGYKGTLKKALDTPFPDENITNEFDYMTQPVLTQTVEGVLDEKQLTEINDAVREAKQDIVNKIDEAAKLEMNEIIDETVEEAMQAEILTQIDKLEGSRELKIMEEVEVLTAKGPDFQINPKLLTEEQKAIYENDSKGKRRLKDRKVFDKNGQMSADTLAQAVGAKSGDELLVIMSRMPSRVEIAKARAEYLREDIESDARESVDLNHTAIEKAYSNKTYNDLRVADFMRMIHWKTKKKLIKLMSLPLRVKALKEQARHAVSQMRVKDLKPKLFMVAQRKSHAIAVKSTLAGDYLKGSTAKEAEALNAQMTIESMKAVADVNRLKRFVQKLKRKSVRDVLKKAGAWPAVTEILDLWNLNASAKGQSKANSYATYAQEQQAKGNGSFIIPDELSDLRESLGDMTVEQVRVIHNRLKQILHNAKEVMATKEGFDAQAQEALDRFATELTEDLSKHPDFDPDRDITQQGKQTEQGKIRRIFGAGLSPLRNIEHITLWLDKHVVGGKLYKVLIEPMKGRGFFNDRGETYKGKLQAIFTEHMEKLIKAFGVKEWQQMHNTWVYVDEFKDSKHLSGGHLTIYNLFQMLLNIGNESNRERLTRGYMEFDDNGKPTKSISIETIMSVLEKHLDEKHFAAAQNIWNMYKTLRKPVRELQLRTKGIEPDFIEGKAFQAHGKMWEGGYYPVITDPEMSLDKLKKNAESVIDVNSGETTAHLQNLHFAEDMTRQGYLETRTKNKQPLDLNHSLGVPFELVIHDLAFREVIRDGMSILTNDKIAKAIKRTVGIHNYNVMLNSVVQLGSSVEAENTLLFDSTKGMKWVYAKARSQAQVAVLAYRLMTMIIQFLSPINTLQLMGVRQGKSVGYATGTVFKMLKYSMSKMGKPEFSREYLAHAFQQLRTNPLNLFTYYQMAADINPKLGNIIQGIDDNIRDPMQKMMPIQYRKGPESIRAATGKYNQYMDKFSIVTTDIAMGILGQIDLSMKVIFTIAAYRQFMNGHAPGVSLEQVQAMTEQQRHETASSYASSVVELTLTAGSQIDRAQIQKELPSIAVFFNDARNHLNNQMRMGREARWAFKDGRYGDAATAVLVLMITTSLYRLAEDMIRGNETPFSGRSDKGYTRRRFDGRKIVKNPGQFLKDFFWYFTTAPVDQFLSNVPLIRDYKYIQDHESPDPRKRKLSAEPFFMKVANDAFLHAPRGVVKKTEEALHYMKLKRANKGFLKLSKREKQAMLFMLMLPTSRGAAVNALVDLFDSTPKATKSLAKELRQVIKSLEAEKPLDKDDAEDLERLKEIENEWPTRQEPEPVDTEVPKEED